MMTPFYQEFFALLEANIPFVCVTLVDAIGSIPQEPGAKMLVTKQGLQTGTVGGGKVEQRALQEAQKLLSGEGLRKGEAIHYKEWNLNRDIGMTCGGSVRLVFELFQTQTWQIVVFGAGHVAQALIPILCGLDCQVTCIDPRQEWLEKLPESPRLIRVQKENMQDIVPQLSDDAFVTLMTMGHSTDMPILIEIMKTNRQFPYLGVIGSKAKAVQVKKGLREAGFPEQENAFYCPIGLPLGNNHPQEIAISIAAQLLQERDRWLEKNARSSGH